LPVPFMKEKTWRYPGHIELMRAMRETGLFSKEAIRVGGVEVRPLDVTSALLFPKWTYGPGEEDLTVMRIVARGARGGKAATLQWDLLDFYHAPTRASSMSRTTGFPCAIVAGLIHAGNYRHPGVNPPERLAEHAGLVEGVLAEHAARGITYTASRT